ncbi:DRTGG domain-containing protein [Alkaliphilus hydrothermalis]|uniref:Serine kinase of HPr protein (Carbohydrate metabolism regulator) n=1 Tax=Alkaliphilus hydrothermalis TaxID=1482730 RepID=A0ABS2NKU4_9FIRM|nr:DRTGG domain-containing protein [Alkaliphilus hydrothermalis]MBM7613565.1 serine kinase of HPr protein (carbohydrate metabolism regulator) [Alkaliphilus hydrothermalis]
MLRVNTLVEKLQLEVVAGADGLEKEVKGMYVGDLLSWVMANIRNGNCWITIQTHVNVIAVALLGEASCIIIPEKAEIDEATIEKANIENIPLLRSPLSAYELALQFGKLDSDGNQ